MKIKDIISKNELEILKLTKSDDEIMSIAKAKYKEQKAQQQTIQSKVNKKPTVKEALQDTIYTDDSVGGDILRGVTTSGIRLVNAVDGLSEMAGFDLVSDKYTNIGNDALDLFEEQKQKTSREGLSKERLAELNELDQQSGKAKGVWENVKAGVDTMVDVVSHPSEWTLQGSVEMVTDPLNAFSFGAGSLAGKLGRTMVQKGVIGGSAGMVEGAVVNSGAEYIIAKGQNKSDEEAQKIALQSAGGGAVAGGTFGTFGGIVSNTAKPIPLEKSEMSDILENELLKTNDMKPLTPDEIHEKLQQASSRYEVVEEYKTEQAGVNKFSIHPEEKGKPNFQLIYDNLPVVRATREIVPVKLKELVDVEILEPEIAKAIELKTQKMIAHEDVIYANYDGWAESISQDIIDGINAKKINDMNKAQKLSHEAHAQSKAIATELSENGATSNQIIDEINNKLVPSKEELQLTQMINDGMPVENRFSGTRLRDKIEGTIELSNAGIETIPPQNLKQQLIKGGVSDELSNVVVSSVINKDVSIFDEHIVAKSSQGLENTTKQLKDTIVKEMKDANIENKRGDKQNISRGKEDGDSATDLKLGEDARSTNDERIPANDGRDPVTNSSDAELSNENKPMEGQSATTDIDGVISKFDTDEVVPAKEETNFATIKEKFDQIEDKQNNEVIEGLTNKEIIPKAHSGISIRDITPQQKKERRLYRELKTDYERKIMEYNYTLEDGSLIRDDKSVDVHPDMIEAVKEIMTEKTKQDEHKQRYVNFPVLKDLDKDISYQEGYDAHSGTSFSPEKRANSEIASWVESRTSEYEALLKLATDNEKLATLNSMFEKYRVGLLKRKKEELASSSRVVSTMIAGRGNFPVARMNKLNGYRDNKLKAYFDYQEKGLQKIKKALIGSDENIIRSDDVDAISKLKNKIETLTTKQNQMKEANKILRNKKFNADEKLKKVKALGLTKDMLGDIKRNGGFASFQLTNNNAKIKTAKQRLKQLENLEQRTKDNDGGSLEYDGGTIVENLENKRIQILFDDIPSVNVRTDLKKNGFKWSPKNKAWQRMLNNDGIYKAKHVMDLHYKKKQSEEVALKFDDAIEKIEKEC